MAAVGTSADVADAATGDENEAPGIPATGEFMVGAVMRRSAKDGGTAHWRGELRRPGCYDREASGTAASATITVPAVGSASDAIFPTRTRLTPPLSAISHAS